jgi:hypothetical protein
LSYTSGFAARVPKLRPVPAVVIVNSEPWVRLIPAGSAIVVDENVAETDPDVKVIVPLTVCE